MRIAAGPTATATASFGSNGQVVVDDAFSGEAALTAAAVALTAPIAAAAANEFRAVMPDRLDVQLRVSEEPQVSTIERAWLDTTKPRAGATHSLHVLLREYRGRTRTIQIPVTMPLAADGPLTLAVVDAASLSTLESRDLRPAQPASIAELFARLGERRQNNRVYVRLLSSTTGTAVAGTTLPALPPSVRSVLDADTTVKSTSVARTVVGAWDERLETAVTGSHELTIRLAPGR